MFIFLVAWCLCSLCDCHSSHCHLVSVLGGGRIEDDKETEADMKNVAGKFVITTISPMRCT